MSSYGYGSNYDYGESPFYKDDGDDSLVDIGAEHGDMIISHLGLSGYLLGGKTVDNVAKVFVATFDDLTTFVDVITG